MNPKKEKFINYAAYLSFVLLMFLVGAIIGFLVSPKLIIKNIEYIVMVITILLAFIMICFCATLDIEDVPNTSEAK